MKLKSFLIISASSLLLTSCLKSRDTLGVFNDKGSIVSEIWDVNYYGDPKVIALDATPPQETIDNFLTLRSYATRDKQPAGGKVHIKLELDPDAVTAAGLTVLPATAYTLPSSLEFDVPAGGEVKIPLTLDKTKMDLSQSYGLGFKITQVSEGIASDLAKSVVVNILVKNKYDGHYQVTGSMVDNVASNLTGNYPMDVYLITSGANSVYMYDNEIGGPAHSILNGSSLSYYGSFSPEFIFDANDNVVQVVNAYGQGAGGLVRSGEIDPTGTNKYNGSDKSLDVKYFLMQGDPASKRTSFDEHFKYLGPR